MNVSKLIATVNAFFEKQEIDFEYDDTKICYEYEFELKGPLESLVCNLSVDKEGYDCIAMARLPIEIREETLEELKLFLFGLDCRMFGGVWQISENTIRYVRCLTICGEGATLTEEMLKDCIFGVPEIVEIYSESIISVIVGKSTADEEIAKHYHDEK